MRCSKECIEALKDFEGLSLTAYQCPGGLMTIGYGHTGEEVVPGLKISLQQAEDYLREDVRFAEIWGENWRKCTQNEFDALVSLIYNIGVGTFSRSTLKKRIDANASPEEIKKQWMRWIYAKGRILPGLQRRRKWEIERYLLSC